jgi:hypothetical protein
MILFAQPAFPANDVRELIALAKAEPGNSRSARPASARHIISPC